MGKNSIKLIANNKKAYHDYFIEDTYEAGIALHGTEVKSVRMGKCSVKESFIRIENGEVIAYGLHISPMKREIFSTATPCGRRSCCFTDMRSIRSAARSRKRDIL